jgi:hypothetical protein
MEEVLWMLKYFVRFLRKTIHVWPHRIVAWIRFWKSYYSYRRIVSAEARMPVRYLYPCLGDDIVETPVEPIYFYQDSWAFERIVREHPSHHIDVGSHHIFVALLSKVIPVTMVDIRPLSLPLDTLAFRKGTIVNLPFESGSIFSLSSLCVVEHVGLGRYGDPLDPDGSEKAIKELMRVIGPGGSLYISMVVDDEAKTYFNAHRALKEEHIMDLFKPFALLDRSYIQGTEFSRKRLTGQRVGCYHLKRD